MGEPSGPNDATAVDSAGDLAVDDGDTTPPGSTSGRKALLVTVGVVLVLVLAAIAFAFWPSPAPVPVGDAGETPVAATGGDATATASAPSSPTPGVSGSPADIDGSPPPRPQPPVVNNPPAGVTVPTAPSDLYLSREGGTFNYHFEWVDRSGNEQGFTVYFSDGHQANVEANTYWYNRKNLPPSTRICFAVAAYNAAGHSAVTDWLCTTTPPPPPTAPPAAPSNTRYRSAGGTLIVVEWNDNSHDEDTFEFRTTRDGVASSYDTGPNATFTPTFQLERGVEYCYDVRASNVAGDSAWSNKVCVRFEPLPPPPAAPSNLQVSFAGSLVRFEWSDNSDNEATFNLTVIQPNVALLLARTLPAGTTSTDWSTAPPATYMCAQVSARNDGGHTNSNKVCFTTPEAST